LSFEGTQSLKVIVAWKGALHHARFLWAAPTIEKEEEELGDEEEEKEKKEERRGTPKSLFSGIVEA
jgi:hypothetical protein